MWFDKWKHNSCTLPNKGGRNSWATCRMTAVCILIVFQVYFLLLYHSYLSPAVMISMHHIGCTINTVSALIHIYEALQLDPVIKLIGTQGRLGDSEANTCRNMNVETHSVILAIAVFIWDPLETSAWNGYSMEIVKDSRFIGVKFRRIYDDPQCDPLNRIHIISLADFFMKPVKCLKKNTYLSKTSNL